MREQQVLISNEQQNRYARASASRVSRTNEALFSQKNDQAVGNSCAEKYSQRWLLQKAFWIFLFIMLRKQFEVVLISCCGVGMA